MGKKKIEKAQNVVITLNNNVEILQQKGIDTSFVKPLEVSVNALVKLKKEISTMSEKLKAKKELFKQKEEEASTDLKSAKAIIKTNLGKIAKENKLKIKKTIKEDNSK